MAVYFGSNKVKPSGIKTVYFGNNKVYESGPTPGTDIYLFNSTVSIISIYQGTFDNLDFTIGGVSYNKIRLTAGSAARIRIYSGTSYKDVYTNSGGWADDAYKTWVINNFSSWPATLVTWVQLNATKQ